jgi:hypothetical protein
VARAGNLLTALTVVAVLLLAVAPALATTAQTSSSGDFNVVNLLNGINVPVVFQGVYSCNTSTSSWPTYYGPSKASQYWSVGGISSDQPVLELTPAQESALGAMFWQAYYLGSNVTVTLIGTYSSGSSPVADGFVFYLFMEPTIWGVEPQYNYSIIYTFTYKVRDNPPLGGCVVLPQSSEPYLVVQWDPYWQYSLFSSKATGPWNVWIVNNSNGVNASMYPNPSPSLGSGYAGWDGIGTGYFQPRPGDTIEVSVTYDPSTNALSGKAYDENTGQQTSFTLSLSGYFSAPGPTYYVFGVAAANGNFSANWAVLYVGAQGLSTTPTTTLTTTTTATVTLVSPTTTTVTSTTTATVMLLTTTTTTASTTTTATVTSTTTSFVTVTSPTTTTVTSTSPTTIISTVTSTVTKAVLSASDLLSIAAIAVAIVAVALVAALRR